MTTSNSKQPSNTRAKRVTPENAYAVYQSPDKQFTYWVLKAYQSEAKETNPYARYFVLTKSPYTSEKGEMGDAYVSSIKNGNILIENPLKRPANVTDITTRRQRNA